MELELERTKLFQVGTISSHETLELLPASKKGKQKLAVGDDTGAVGCWEMKRGEPLNIFSSPLGERVTALALGGSADKKDKLFASTGSEVVGLNKKGKNFFQLVSMLAERIQCLRVEDTHIWTTCEYIYTKYDEGKDVHSYISPDKINSLDICNGGRAVLGCQDRCVRVLNEHGDLEAQIAAAGEVTALSCYDATNRKVVYGTENGLLKMFTVGATNSDDGRSDWRPDLSGITVKNSALASVNCIKFFDISKDGVKDVVIGRDDGTVNIYGFENGLDAPSLIFNGSVGESIQGLQVGNVSSVDFDEIVVCGFSGEVVSFTNEPLNTLDKEDKGGRTHNNINNENKIR
jgi:Bardet-Biedl syndrome 7 protein